MLISVVIPTRDRPEYLEHSIKSALSSSRGSGMDVEIVVCDNASSESTAECVSAIRDTRVVYKRVDRRISMRANFEEGLNSARGDYFVFIGDDDGFSIDGLKVLSGILKSADYDVVNWPQTNYTWPGVNSDNGWGKIRYRNFDGGLRKKDLESIGNKFLSASYDNYHQGALIYHGCVSRGVVESVRNVTGSDYFLGASPDLFAAVANCFSGRESLGYVDYSVTIGGASPKSNGLNASISPRGRYSDEYEKFVAEARGDQGFSLIGPSMKSFGLYVLEALVMSVESNRLQAEVNLDNWQLRLVREISELPEAERAVNFECAGMLFSRINGHFRVPDSAPERASVSDVPRSKTTSINHKKLSVTSLEISDNKNTRTITDFGQVVQRVCPSPSVRDVAPGLQQPLRRLASFFRAFTVRSE